MNSDTPVVEIERLVRRYGRRDAVDGLSLRVGPGRCYGFFGRKGAGKTTTIKCLLNLLRPTSGSVKVFGMDLRTIRQRPGNARPRRCAWAPLWALLMSLPALLGAVLFVRVLADPMERVALFIVSHQPALMALHGVRDEATAVMIFGTALLIGAALVAVVLRLALANYRSADRAPGRSAEQVIGIAGCLAVALILIGGVVTLQSGARL